jgi:hypothetical protein
MIQQLLKVRVGTVWFNTGHIYTFKYKNFQFDPEPTVIVLYTVKGVHPNTGHYHHYIQAINFTYIPRGKRREFLYEWKKLFNFYEGNVYLTWDTVKRRYPYMQIAIRRYLLDGNLINNGKEIPTEDWEEVVISTWARDYSKQALMMLMLKYKKTTNLFKSVIKNNKIFGGKKEFGGKV